MPKTLPVQPSLEQLKKQAKELLSALHAKLPAALARAQAHHPDWSGALASSLAGASFKLHDTQLILAREYGLESWAKLKERVAELNHRPPSDPLALFQRAFHNDDAALMRTLFEQYPAVKARINDPVAAFDSPPITGVKSRAMLDVFLDAGADINAKSRWWAGGFGLLHCAAPDLAAYAIERGAAVDIHAAARLGLVERVRECLATDPQLVHARGGDGQTPLHFAQTAEVAQLLLGHGADPNARDVDHESTPAQYMIADRPDVARFLVSRGCQTDLLLAAALGDQALAERHLKADPGCIRMRVNDEFFPKATGKSGGTIYQWTLGWHVSARQVAARFGHAALARWLRAQAPAEVQLTDDCWLHDETNLQTTLAADPGLVRRLLPSDQRQLAHAARNNDSRAVRLFLRAGWPVDVPGQHGATPLHWAAWHGNLEMVNLVLERRPPLEGKDADFQGTPLRWAVHGSEHGWHKERGDYGAVVKALLAAGARPPAEISGSEPVQAALGASLR